MRIVRLMKKVIVFELFELMANKLVWKIIKTSSTNPFILQLAFKSNCFYGHAEYNN